MACDEQVRRMPVIGVVGGVGAGKSVVAGLLAGLGCDVLDADVLAQAILSSDPVRSALIERWGPEVAAEDGGIDRPAVADRVFADPAELAWLEAQVHPPVLRAIRDRIQAALRAGRIGVVLDAPKLFEAGLDADCDAIICVEAAYETRQARVQTDRSWAKDELDRRENRQMPLDKKRRQSQYVLQNQGDIADLKCRVEALFQQIRERMISDTHR